MFKKYYASYKSLIVAYAQEYEADKYIDHIQIFNAAKDEWEEICERGWKSRRTPGISMYTGVWIMTDPYGYTGKSS